MSRGIFISIEGGDGAGKSTQMDYIEKWILSQGKPLCVTREPGGTALGECLREIVLSGHQFEVVDDAELLLMFAARAQHIQAVIKPALKLGKWVLCDRFTDASYAYQGGGRGIAVDRIQTLETWLLQGLKPDLTFVLDVPVEQGLKRVTRRGNALDRFEAEEILFKERVRQAYLAMAKHNPQRMKVIDATQSVEKVKEYIFKQLIESFVGWAE